MFSSVEYMPISCCCILTFNVHLEALEWSGVINGIGCTIMWSQSQHIVIYA